MSYNDLEYYSHINMLIKHHWSEHHQRCEKGSRCPICKLSSAMVVETTRRLEDARVYMQAKKTAEEWQK